MSSSPLEVAVATAAPARGALRPILVLVIGTGIRWFGFSFYGLFLLLFFHSALHLGYVVAGLYIAILGFVTLPLGQLGGGISDRIGRRRMIVLSLAGETTGLALLAWGFSISSLAAVLGALLISRSFGVTGSPAAFAYIADNVDLKFRAKGLSWLRVALNLGAFGGVALGGALLTFVTYGQLTALAALMVGSAAIVSAVWLTPTVRDLTIVREGSGGARSTSSPSTGPFRWLGQSMYSSFRPIWRDRTLLLVVLASIMIWLMVEQVFYAIPTFSLTFLGVPFAILGLALSLTGLIPVLTQVPLTSALSGRLHTRIGIWGAVAYAVSYLAFGLDAIYRLEVVLALFVLMIVSTLGEDLIYLPVFTLPLNIAPDDARGAYSGAIVTASALGGIFSPLLAGVALAHASQPIVTWGILAAPAIPAIAILAYLGSHLPPSRNRI